MSSTFWNKILYFSPIYYITLYPNPPVPFYPPSPKVMWLYEELLGSKPKTDIKEKKHNDKVAREKRKAKKEALEKEAEDRMLTVDEVKDIKRKEAIKWYSQTHLWKEKIKKALREEDNWFTIWRRNVYLGKDFWDSMWDIYEETMSKCKETSGLFWSENEIRDIEYLNWHKYDWMRDGSRFWMSWYCGYMSKSNARDKCAIWSPIKLIATQSLQKIYNNYLDGQEATRKHLEGLAKERWMTVRDFVKRWYRYEDLIKGWRWRWVSRRATYKPREWSWLEEVTKDIIFKYRITSLDYIRMIYEDKFMLSEALIPFRTYIVWDFVLFGNKACAVPSMFWNWEYFNQENRELIHHRWQYALMLRPNFNIANKVPIFYWDDMKLVRVSDEKIYDKEDKVWHNNWHYSYYLVPELAKLGKLGPSELSMEEIINKFHTPSAELMEVRWLNPTTTKEEMKFVKKQKRNIFYFDTSS